MRQHAETKIVGYLSKDAELRHTREGRPVLGLTVPYTRRRFDKQKNEYVDAGPTLWVQASLWDDVATAFEDKLRKGTPVVIEGIPELRTWERDGRSGVNFELVFPRVSIVADVPRAQQQASAPQPDPAEAWGVPGAWGDDTPF